MTSQEWTGLAELYEIMAREIKNENPTQADFYAHKAQGFRSVVAYAEERDTLLSALKNLIDLAEAQFATAPDLWEVNEAKAAIAKVEGATTE